MEMEPCYLFFDLETTGFGDTCDITQLSVVSGEQVFNVYMVPRCDIEPKASEVTGLTKCGEQLFLHGAPVKTVPIQEALTSFIAFLRRFSNPILVAHNCKEFDAPILMRILKEFDLDGEFRKMVFAFLDTLEISKEMFPGLKKYNQSFLVDYFLKETYNAHEATDDARLLQKLFQTWNPPQDLVKKHRFQL